MSEKIEVGTVVDASTEAVFVQLKKLKTSLTNLRLIAKMEKDLNVEFTIYREAINTYIIQNGDGETPETMKLDLSNDATREAYVGHVVSLRQEKTDIDKLHKAIFTEAQIEEKGIELSLNEALIYGKLGIVPFDLEAELMDEVPTDEEVVEGEIAALELVKDDAPQDGPPLKEPIPEA